MFVFSNFLLAIAQLLNIALSIYMWIIIVRALISWVSADPYNPVVRFLYQVTEPVLYRIRRYIPPLGGLDFAPIVAFFIIIFIQKFFVTTLIEIALKMKIGGG